MRSIIFTPESDRRDRTTSREPNAIGSAIAEGVERLAKQADALKQGDLYQEPESEILLLGEMWRDVRTMQEMLPQLPMDDRGYTGNLRVMLGCCRRIDHRLRRLLGEPAKSK